MQRICQLLRMSILTFLLNSMGLAQDHLQQLDIKHLVARMEFDQSCALETAANMMDYFRFNHLHDQDTHLHTSAVMLKLGFIHHHKPEVASLETFKSFHEGIGVCQAFNYILKHGFYPREKVELPLKEMKVTEKIQQIASQKANMIYGILQPNQRNEGLLCLNQQQLSERFSIFKISPIIQALQSIDYQFKKEEKNKEREQMIMAQKGPNKAYAILKEKLKKSDLKIINQPPSLSYQCQVSKNQTEFIPQLHQYFQAKDQIKLPIAIGFCGYLLFYGPSYKGDPQSPSCGKHASMVVGKKVYQGQTFFALLNTWGNQEEGQGCAGVHESFECEGEKGIIWVPQESLKANMFSLYSLAPAL